MSAISLDLHEWIEAFRAEIASKRLLHVDLYTTQMHAAVDMGDNVELARLVRNVRHQVAREISWQASDEAEAMDHRMRLPDRIAKGERELRLQFNGHVPTLDQYIEATYA
jgi:hypothetical protein